MEHATLNSNRKYDDRCRVCLECAESTICLINTASLKEQTLSYWDILAFITRIQRENSSNTPQKICIPCAKRAEAFYEFKVLCENSDRIVQRELDVIHKMRDEIKIELEDWTEPGTIVENKNTINPPDLWGGNSSNYTELNNSDFILDSSSEIKEETSTVNSCDSTDCENETPHYTNLNTYQFNDFEYPNHVINENNVQFKDILSNYESNLELNLKSINNNQNFLLDTREPNQEISTENEIVCENCPQKFSEKSSLMKHMQRCREKPEKCKLCNFIPNSYRAFCKHMLEEHETIIDAKECEFCNFSTFCSIKMGKHLSLFHDDKKLLQCPKCDKKFFKKRSVFNHMKRLHEKNIPIICEVCGKAFKEKANLRKHMDIHNGIKNYECGVCGKRCTQAASLYRHKLTHMKEGNSSTSSTLSNIHVNIS